MKKEWAFVLQGETRKHIDDEPKANSLLEALRVLYKEEKAMCTESTEHEFLVTDHVSFFFKAYEASLRKARALGIVDSPYMERHVEILRSTPVLRGNMSILTRHTSELKLIVEEFFEEIDQDTTGEIAGDTARDRGEVQEYKELTGRPGPQMATPTSSDDDPDAQILSIQKRKMRHGW